MKKITNEEFSTLALKLENRNHPVRDYLLQLQTGEILQVNRNEWKWRTKSPSFICRSIERKTTRRFDCFKLTDGTGWVIKRTK